MFCTLNFLLHSSRMFRKRRGNNLQGEIKIKKTSDSGECKRKICLNLFRVFFRKWKDHRWLFRDTVSLYDNLKRRGVF